MKSVKEIFAERLKELLELKGKSQAQLAKELGTTPQAVNSYVKGKTTPDYDILCRISDILGVSVDFLLGGESTLSQEEQQLLTMLEDQNAPDIDILLKKFRQLVVVREKMRSLYGDYFEGLISDSSLLFQFYDEINSVINRYNSISNTFCENSASSPERAYIFSSENFADKLCSLLDDPDFVRPATDANIVKELIQLKNAKRSWKI